MNCFAIWYTPKKVNGLKRIDAEVHVNLWKLKEKGKKSFDHFLDMGIMIEDKNNIESINIFIPSKINKSEIEDLGNYFKKHTDLVPTVFNRDYIPLVHQKKKIIEVLNRDKEHQFNIYRLDVDHDIKIKNIDKGSVIRILVSHDITGGKTYYRVRIKSKVVESLSHIEKPANAILESAFYSTELVDFRINEKRNLDSTLLAEIHENGEVNFKPIHFFLMREAYYDYIFSCKKLYRSRDLEEELWDSYVGENYSFGKIIAYQWKEECSESFNEFVKFRFRISNSSTIVIYVIFALLIAAIGGVIGVLLVEVIRAIIQVIIGTS